MTKNCVKIFKNLDWQSLHWVQAEVESHLLQDREQDAHWPAECSGIILIVPSANMHITHVTVIHMLIWTIVPKTFGGCGVSSALLNRNSSCSLSVSQDIVWNLLDYYVWLFQEFQDLDHTCRVLLVQPLPDFQRVFSHCLKKNMFWLRPKCFSDSENKIGWKTKVPSNKAIAWSSARIFVLGRSRALGRKCWMWSC